MVGRRQATLKMSGVWTVLHDSALIIRQACVMFPDVVWVIVAGSPHQDLTYAGYLHGMLALTGKKSSLFFVVYIVIYYLQQLAAHWSGS